MSGFWASYGTSKCAQISVAIELGRKMALQCLESGKGQTKPTHKSWPTMMRFKTWIPGCVVFRILEREKIRYLTKIVVGKSKARKFNAYASEMRLKMNQFRLIRIVSR